MVCQKGPSFLMEKCHLLKRYDVSALLSQSVNHFCHLWAGHSNHHLHHRSPGLPFKHPFMQTSWRLPTPWLVPAKERGRIKGWLKSLQNTDMIRRIIFWKTKASWDKSCWALHSQCPAMTYSKSSPWKVSSRRRQSLWRPLGMDRTTRIYPLSRKKNRSHFPRFCEETK